MLQDLIIANHYFLYVMEKVVEQGQLQKIKRAKLVRREKKIRAKKQMEHLDALSKSTKLEVSPNEIWITISEEVSDAVNGIVKPNEDISPVDGLLNADDDQLQVFALLRIQIALRNRNICDAVGIYRAARIIWPETGVFGNDEISTDEEFQALHEIFDKDLSEISKDYEKLYKEAYGNVKAAENEENSVSDNEPGQEEMDELDEDKNSRYTITEVPFEFDEFLSSCFGEPNVINWYIFMFKEFRTNPIEVNKAILKLFHRIAFGIKSPSRLYQASLFKILREIGNLVMEYPTESIKQHKYYNLFEFGNYLLNKFFSHYNDRGSTLICELLFSKSSREAYEIENGYVPME